MADNANNGQIRFGVFELDPRTRELRRNGVLVKLQDQPFQVLLALIEKPGELVTREELEKRIWPGDTFVDFEVGLSRAVNKLREALGDTAENSRFVQTLPKRGYRFIAPVDGGVRTPERPAPVENQKARRRLRSWAIAAGLLLTGVLVTGLWPVQAPRVVSVVRLTNDGDPKPGWMTTDGRTMLFVRARDFNSHELWQVPVEGGEERKLPKPSEEANILGLHGYSPATKQVLLSAQPIRESKVIDLWLMDIRGESPRKIGQQPNRAFLALAPDGKRIAVSTQEGIFIQEIESGQRRKIVELNEIRGLTWHPSGRQIGWVTPAARIQDIRAWVVDEDGKNNKRAVPEAEMTQTVGSWSRDGRDFFFSSSSSHPELWVRRKPGFLGWMRKPVVERLTASGIFANMPFTCPLDSSRLYAVITLRRGETVRYDRKGGQWRALVPGLSADWVEFSPDEKWILYVRYPENDLWKSKVDGTEAVQLTSGLSVMSPKWSPDSSRIAFTAVRKGSGADSARYADSRLYVIPSAGGEVRPLDSFKESAVICSWAPDGHRIAYAHYGRNFLRDPRELLVKIIDLDKGTIETVPGSEGRNYPRWSPNGRTISANDLPARLHFYDFATRKWTSMPEGVYISPEWSRDSKWIHCGLGRMSERVRIEVATKRIERLVALGFPTTANAFAWHGLTPDGDPITLRNYGTRDIARVDLK